MYFNNFIQGLFRPSPNEQYYKDNIERLGIPLKELIRLQAFEYWQNVDTETTFFNQPFQLSSPYWFLQTIEEIFIHEVYKFETDNPNPLIIDCGASWGLSVMYFHRNHPGATIIAYEADRKIYDMALQNFRSFGLEKVTLHNKAVWTADGSLIFASEGSVGGSVKELAVKAVDQDFSDAPADSWVGNFNTYHGVFKLQDMEVESVRLKNVLDDFPTVDFLKIDIEGAEYQVLIDCADSLRNVQKMFIEYHSTPKEPQQLDEILLILKNAGFRYYIKEATNNYTHPFIRNKDVLYDLQLNIFCFR